MKLARLLAAAACLAVVLGSIAPSVAGEGNPANRRAARRADATSWHGYFYDPAWGMPVALVVPPTARAQSHYGWGVSETRVTPINHQYGAAWQGPPSAYDGRYYDPMPPYPTNTDRMGVYYVRGPW